MKLPSADKSQAVTQPTTASVEKTEAHETVQVSPSSGSPVWTSDQLVMAIIERGSPLAAILLLIWLLQVLTNFVKAVREE